MHVRVFIFTINSRQTLKQIMIFLLIVNENDLRTTACGQYIGLWLLRNEKRITTTLK